MEVDRRKFLASLGAGALSVMTPEDRAEALEHHMVDLLDGEVESAVRGSIAALEEMGAELPDITKFVIGVSDYVTQYGIYAIGVLGGCGYMFRRYMRTDAGLRRALERRV